MKEMDEKELTNMLSSVRLFKHRAIKNMKYALAAQLRDVEKELLNELDSIHEDDELYDFKFNSPEEFEFVLNYISRVDKESYKKLLEAFKKKLE